MEYFSIFGSANHLFSYVPRCDRATEQTLWHRFFPCASQILLYSNTPVHYDDKLHYLNGFGCLSTTNAQVRSRWPIRYDRIIHVDRARIRNAFTSGKAAHEWSCSSIIAHDNKVVSIDPFTEITVPPSSQSNIWRNRHCGSNQKLHGPPGISTHSQKFAKTLKIEHIVWHFRPNWL